MAAEPTTEHPVYSRVAHDEGSATVRYMVICDEGWRQSIVCEGMYDWAAHWLIGQLQGKPYAPAGRPGGDS
jgi:hypothetical protein